MFPTLRVSPELRLEEILGAPTDCKCSPLDHPDFLGPERESLVTGPMFVGVLSLSRHDALKSWHRYEELG